MNKHLKGAIAGFMALLVLAWLQSLTDEGDNNGLQVDNIQNKLQK